MTEIMTNNMNNKQLFGTAKRPRVCVSRSNIGMLAQVIDDSAGKTIFAISTKMIKERLVPIEKSKALGILIAKTAKENKITEMIFDRNNLRYHGRVQALADGIREGGIKI